MGAEGSQSATAALMEKETTDVQGAEYGDESLLLYPLPQLRVILHDA